MNAVFDTIELAEKILGELCMRDLLISVQRTCKQWKDAIDGSTRLQEALFFRPINKKRLVYRGRTKTEHYQRWTNDMTDRPFSDSSCPIYEHPIVTNKCSKIENYGRDWYLNPERDIMGRPEASWRRQLITQPPLAELNWWDFDDGGVEITGTVRATSPAGLRMQDFVGESGKTLPFGNKHEGWTWLESKWDHAPAIAAIEPARRAEYAEGQWVAVGTDL